MTNANITPTVGDVVHLIIKGMHYPIPAIITMTFQTPEMKSNLRLFTDSNHRRDLGQFKGLSPNMVKNILEGELYSVAKISEGWYDRSADGEYCWCYHPRATK